MDNRTIRNAIMKRIPEIKLIELIKHPEKPDRMVIACTTIIEDAISGDHQAIGIEEDDFPIGGSHKELMNVVDNIAREVDKYKKRNKDIKLYAEQGLKSALDNGLRISPGGIILS